MSCVVGTQQFCSSSLSSSASVGSKHRRVNRYRRSVSRSSESATEFARTSSITTTRMPSRSAASDNVLCRAVADDKSNRTPLINLEGGRQISYVRCSCSKCQGLVMCGEKELLPTAVTPQHYDLRLTPDLETFTYTGEVTVQLHVHEPCTAVTFHAKELAISAGILVDATGVRQNEGGINDASQICVFVRVACLAGGMKCLYSQCTFNQKSRSNL